MTYDTQQANTTDPKSALFGARLKSAREMLGMERKEAAAQLRLSEKVITMMEKEIYPSDLPVTFIRGYIRAYGKFLDIPEHEIRKAIEPIKPKPTTQEIAPNSKQQEPVTSGNYFVQLFTYLIVFTLLGLVGMWWYSHSSTPRVSMEKQLAALPELTTPPVTPVNPLPNAGAVTAANTGTNPATKPPTAASTPNTVAAPLVAQASPAAANATHPAAPTPAATPTNKENIANAAPATKVPVVASAKRKKAVTVEELSDSDDDDTANTSANNTEANSDNAD